ncbi:hypothetical protein F4809DRAFT_429173 [Biscogniauxia mediterranea]|nr:hypothetical protein F4809DRAFT_429173 [Biscogniauxia mediterranea]
MGDTFHWKLDGLDRQRFEAYTKLLSLRHGGQASDPVTFEPLDEDLDIVELPDDDDSVVGQQLTSHGKSEIRRAFLDRLSEILASAKGGYHVAAALMVQSRDMVEISVAKNRGIKQKDKAFIESFENVLRKIPSVKHCTSCDEYDELWELLVDQYETRINGYISDLRRALDPTQLEQLRHCHSESWDGVIECVDKLFALLHDDKMNTNTLLLEAHAIRKLFTISQFESIDPKKPSFGRKIYETINLLGRLRGAFWTFIRGAERIEGFDQLRVRCVELQSLMEASSKRKRKMLRTRAWTIGQAFKSLDLPFTDERTKALMSSGADKVHINTKDKLVSKFDKLKAPDDEIHAEVQLVLDLARRASSFDEAFKYIGCSKRSCLLCASLISNIGSFTTRGCHGKVYGLWVIPELNGLNPNAVESIHSGVKKLEDNIKEILLDRQGRPIVHAKESTIGGSSIATAIPSTDDQDLASLIASRLSIERQHAASGQSFERSVSPEYSADSDEEFLPSQIAESPRTPATQGECHACEEMTERHCSLCGRDWFCNLSCQSKMGIYHLFQCNARPLTTADYLYKSCLSDEFPDDPEVLEDFGFTRCKSTERTFLLGVYIGLFLHLQVSSEKVDLWRREDTLLENIKREFAAIPERSRGRYFPWLLRNTHVLRRDTPVLQRGDPGVGELQQMIDDARPYLESDDRNKDFDKLEPMSKQYCFLFFAITIGNTHPPPTEVTQDMWYNFGFPACVISSFGHLDPQGIQHSESRLGSFYNSFFCGNKIHRDRAVALDMPYYGPPDRPTCSFREFWTCWNLSILPLLFDKYGYGKDADQSWPYLRKYLSTPPQERPLVWRLCQYLAIWDVNAVDTIPVIRAAAEAYGIHSSLNAKDRLMMYEFYRRLLPAVNPLQLDEACQKGTLLKFTTQHLDNKLDPGIKSVLVRLDISKRV